MGCGRKKAKNELLRFSLNAQGRLVVDSNGIMLGRGVYCCNEQDCFNIFLKNKRKVSKALRLQELLIDEELKGLFGSK